LALDEPKDTDDLFDAGGYQFVVDKDLALQAGLMKVDMTYMGFTVQSSWSWERAAAAARARRARRVPAERPERRKWWDSGGILAGAACFFDNM
jgi:hypothetical protein